MILPDIERAFRAVVQDVDSATLRALRRALKSNDTSVISGETIFPLADERKPELATACCPLAWLVWSGGEYSHVLEGKWAALYCRGVARVGDAAMIGLITWIDETPRRNVWAALVKMLDTILRERNHVAA